MVAFWRQKLGLSHQGAISGMFFSNVNPDQNLLAHLISTQAISSGSQPFMGASSSGNQQLMEISSLWKTAVNNSSE